MSAIPPGGWCGTTPPGGRKKRSKTVAITFKDGTNSTRIDTVLAELATRDDVTYAGRPNQSHPSMTYKGSLTVKPNADLVDVFAAVRAYPEVADVEEIVPLHDEE